MKSTTVPHTNQPAKQPQITTYHFGGESMLIGSIIDVL